MLHLFLLITVQSNFLHNYITHSLPPHKGFHGSRLDTHLYSWLEKLSIPHNLWQIVLGNHNEVDFANFHKQLVLFIIYSWSNRMSSLLYMLGSSHSLMLKAPGWEEDPAPTGNFDTNQDLEVTKPLGVSRAFFYYRCSSQGTWDPNRSNAYLWTAGSAPDPSLSPWNLKSNSGTISGMDKYHMRLPLQLLSGSHSWVRAACRIKYTFIQKIKFDSFTTMLLG